jgi:hypothetical protein
VAALAFGVLIHHWWPADIRIVAVSISVALSLLVRGLRKLRTTWRSIGFESLILRRFSLHSDLLTRRAVGPVFAACGRTETVVPAPLRQEDEADSGAIMGKGLRRSWIEKVVDAQIRQTAWNPLSWGVFILPRGAFAQTQTLTFTDAEWRDRVLQLLARADTVVIEVSDLSEAVQFEVSNALKAVPESRIIFLAQDGAFAR